MNIIARLRFCLIIPQFTGGNLGNYPRLSLSSEVGSVRNTEKKRRGEKMKYVLFWEVKEPFEENLKKSLEIMKKRGKRKKKHDTIGMYMLLSEPKGFTLIETDDISVIPKFMDDYNPVLKLKISPIMSFSEWTEATK
jgi:hypothetical protein